MLNSRENEHYSPKRNRIGDELILSQNDTFVNEDIQYRNLKQKRTTQNSSQGELDLDSSLNAEEIFSSQNLSSVDRTALETETTASSQKQTQPSLFGGKEDKPNMECDDTIVTTLLHSGEDREHETIVTAEDGDVLAQIEESQHIQAVESNIESPYTGSLKISENEYHDVKRKRTDSVLSQRSLHPDLSPAHITQKIYEETSDSRLPSLHLSSKQAKSFQGTQEPEVVSIPPQHSIGNKDEVVMEEAVPVTHDVNEHTAASTRKYPLLETFKELTIQKNDRTLPERHNESNSEERDTGEKVIKMDQYEVDDDLYFGGIDTPTRNVSQYEDDIFDSSENERYGGLRKGKQSDWTRRASQAKGSIYPRALDDEFQRTVAEHARRLAEFLKEDDTPVEISQSELESIVKRMEKELNADNRVAKRRKQADAELSAVIDPINKTIIEFRDEQRDSLTKRVVIEFGKNTTILFEELKVLYHEHMQLEWKLKRVKNLQNKERKRLLDVRKQKEETKNKLNDNQNSINSSRANRKEWMELKTLFNELKAAPIQTLTPEILVNVAFMLDTSSILAFSLTCKHFSTLISNDLLFRRLVQRDYNITFKHPDETWAHLYQLLRTRAVVICSHLAGLADEPTEAKRTIYRAAVKAPSLCDVCKTETATYMNMSTTCESEENLKAEEKDGDLDRRRKAEHQLYVQELRREDMSLKHYLVEKQWGRTWMLFRTREGSPLPGRISNQKLARANGTLDPNIRLPMDKYRPSPETHADIVSEKLWSYLEKAYGVQGRAYSEDDIQTPEYTRLRIYMDDFKNSISAYP
ncbi:hypothetical protein DFQ28_011372 [Apophysomyces sp. BC1034]|nr:hypothetical protein DFQ29_009790 [Apophysomyces sp. BC1021]KAG0184332.1 hypothetical protein DFQ28_011372 [Apophysomyces sp. BC1034]